MVRDFTDDVCTFIDTHEDMELTNYSGIIENCGIKLGIVDVSKLDVSDLDAQCVLALIVGNIRADRFCEGALLDSFNNGCILRWLERLEQF